MNISTRRNYIKTYFTYILAQVKAENPGYTDQQCLSAARTTMKESLSKRFSIGDGFEKEKPTSPISFEVKVRTSIRGLKPIRFEALQMDGVTWTLIEEKPGPDGGKDEIKDYVFECPDEIKAIRLYDPIDGIYSNVYKLKNY